MTINEAQIREDWQQRNFSFDIWQDSPGQVWVDFVHNVDELFMVVEGDVELMINGKSLHPEMVRKY